MSNGGSPTPRGQLVKPEMAQDRTIANSVAEFVSSVTLQPSATKEGYEKVEWVSFEECDLTDLQLKTLLRNVVGSEVPLVMVLGLANGYQAWVLMSNGECEEFLSVRMGRVKFVKFLPHPESGFDVNNDAFPATRPLAMICDSTSAGRPYCALNISSLKTGDVVHSLRFDEPVGNLICNKRAIVASFPAKIVVYDAASITELFSIKGEHGPEKLESMPVALGSSWLAYSDSKLNTSLQSCGGVSLNETSSSYTSQVMNAAKTISKTVSTIGETVATSITGTKSGGRSRASKSGSQSSFENAAMVTVIDIKSFPKTQTSIHTSTDAATGVVAHFVASVEERVAALKFNNTSSLLFTSGSSGQQFNLFLILPHPSSPVLGAVHHLYTLHRGSTNAKIQEITFAPDSRWVTVTTANGTTHIFPITPYGGAVTVRTHGGSRVANKESRFYRSAGLDSLDAIGPSSPPLLSSSPVATKASPIAKDSHPSMNVHHMSLNRVVSNPRLPPYPTPTIVYALAKIKQQFGSALGNLATQEAPPTKKHGSNVSGDEQQRISTVFAAMRGLKTLNPAQKFDEGALVFFVLNYCGEVAEYVFNVKPSSAGQGSKISSDSHVELTILPGAHWQIGRQKRHADLPAPLSGQHLLMMASEMAKSFYADSCRSLLRDQTQGVYSNVSERRPTSQPGDVSWISEVEMVTYSGPHRRLWMGPQFTFKTYVDQQHSASLVTPSDKTKRSEPMAVPGRVPLRSIPVLIEAGSVGSIDQLPGPTVEICGSWSDNDYISCDEQEGRLRESIADAMRDQSFGGQRGGDRPSGSSEELSSVGSESRRFSDSIKLNHSPSRESQLQFAAEYIDP